MPKIFTQKNNIVMDIVILAIFLGGSYYLYTLFSEPDTVVTNTQINEQLLGKNFVLFLKAVNKDKISLTATEFMNGNLAKQLQDFSEEINPELYRGRLNPFEPYASTRSIR